MSHYQGHLADGSSVQKHSAGGLYPYVIYAKQQGDALRWGYIAPDGSDHLVADSYGGACDAAIAHRDHAKRPKAFKAGREWALLACHIAPARSRTTCAAPRKPSTSCATTSTR